MILEFGGVWYTFMPLAVLGPYAERSGAENAQAMYEAYQTNAGGCHACGGRGER